MNLLTNTNQKIKKTGKLNSTRLYEFNLPAVITCPFAGSCKSICYADKGTYLYSNVKKKYQFNFELTKQTDFIQLIQKELELKRVEAVRIHSSGDFYSLNYLKKWIKIAQQNPNVLFYGYTKSVPLFKNVTLPSNFIFCFSDGGTHDKMIKETDRRAVIFDTLEAMTEQGFIDCSENDLLMTKTYKIGLLKH